MSQENRAMQRVFPTLNDSLIVIYILLYSFHVKLSYSYRIVYCICNAYKQMWMWNY